MMKILRMIILFGFFAFSFYIDKYFYCKKFISKCLTSFPSKNKNYIVIVFGTRSESIKIIPIIKKLKQNKNYICILIYTGQHKKMINQIFQSLDMPYSIDINLHIMRKSHNPSELTSKILLELDKIYSIIHPNAVIVQGDTTTAYAAAISAFYQKIPVFHIEAGLRAHNLYSPFPEEFNRLTIDDISTLYFAPTELAASNLLKEGKNPSKIFITGNTIVDSLKIILEKTSSSNNIHFLLKASISRCKPKNNCKIILLTCHRRENIFEPIIHILKAVRELLENFDDIVIILLFDLNSNIKKSIKMGLPSKVYSDLINGKEINNPNYLFFNRLLLIESLNYVDYVHLLSSSFFIMTDSSGIQEEAASIGKPVLILRDTIDRPESIKLGSAVLTGASPNKIFDVASLLLKNDTIYKKMALPHNSYGFGNSSDIILKIIENFFSGESSIANYITLNNLNNFNYNKILTQYNNLFLNSSNDNQYDLVIVLTVWKRNNLKRQLIQIKRQSILKAKKTNIIVFQNSNHINVDNIIEEWQKPGMLYDSVKITFIKSPIETGYYGRFISPLISPVTSNAYFIVCDDDIIWGDRYFENMLRVVDEGFLATRNGRLIDKNYNEILPNSKIFEYSSQVCFNEDIEYDFGSHIWAGRISWLRKAWSHVPISIENCEDFWLSTTLKKFYNIATRTPKCPCPKNYPIQPDLCAASDKSASAHINCTIGKTTINNEVRIKLIKEISKYYNYKPLVFLDPDIIDKIKNKFIFGNTTNPLFDLSDSLWNNVLVWQ